jgi:hypothetical protein
MDLSFYLQKANEVIKDPTPPANATLSFELGNGVVTFDALGNPVVGAGTTVEIHCWLKQSKPPEKTVQAGLNLDKVFFVGELQNPKTYPLPLRPNGQILVTINGRQGTFTELENFDSPTGFGLEINKYHGQKIAGWIQIKEGN